MPFRPAGLFVLFCLFALTVSRATTPVSAPESSEAKAWFDQFQSASAPPFSFTYNGLASASLLSTWKVTSNERSLDSQRTERIVTYTDSKTGLELRCVAVCYRDFPTIEWTVYFKNIGTADTPILENIQALDLSLKRPGEKEFLLHHAFGTFYPLSAADFMPQATLLAPGSTTSLIPYKGRASGNVMPYFNLERGDGSGVIAAIGWPGAWAAHFTRDDKTGLDLTAGQETTHLRLHPGEEIRTPLIALQFWRGDWIDAQNTWRRWLLAHNLPKTNGQPPKPLFMATAALQFNNMTEADEASQFLFIDRYREEKFPIDGWWMDAGWYEITKSWEDVVAWRVDKKRFPRGLRPITDYARSFGLKNVLWFEPERVRPTSELMAQHPEWLLANHISKRTSKMLNLGNPAALAWLIDTISDQITKEGIEIYRQDYTFMEPGEIWQSSDADDRKGIAENHHVTGYLAFWDALLHRHPGLIIDNCAAGGGRLDLESLRRSLVFWRSDYIFDVVSNQSQTYGLSLWLPYFGTGGGPKQTTTYELRSNMANPLFIGTWDLRDKTLPYDDLRKAVREWRDYAPNYTGDFYPLTPDSIAADVWLAWQFNRPEAGRGVIQAFRRDASIYQTARVKLRGLDSTSRYRLTDLDAPATPRELSGRELMETGLVLTIAAQPGAIILTYEKLP